MTTEGAPQRRSLSALDVARGLFLVGAVAFGWWGLRSSGPEIRAALANTSPVRVVVACVVVMAGLSLTAAIWRRILAGYGHALPVRAASAIFFVGQLGKYIPGSIWSLGAQADMARAHRVPPRTTVAVGLLFLWVHLASAVAVSALLGDLAAWPALDHPWLRVMTAVAALVGLMPGVLAWVGDRLARADVPLRLTWRDSGWLIGIMSVVWLAYGLGLVLVVPPDDLAEAGGISAVLAPFTGAFAIAYVVGVLVILAPAGVGAREATLIALLAPVLGLPVAAATALMIRAVHTVCDFAIAAIAWLAAGRGRVEPSHG